MLPGILKDRIDIYTESTTKNDFSENVRSFTYAFYDRAQLLFTRGTEAATLGLETPDKSLRIKVRFHLSRYNERQMIKWRGDYYNIRAIEQDTDRVFQNLICDRIPVDSIKIIDPDLT